MKKTETWRSKRTGENLLSALSEYDEIIVYDTETTGLNSITDRIIQISGIKLDCKTLEEKDRIDLYINPGFPIPLKITGITGITDSFLADKPLEKEVFPIIYRFFGETPVVSGYNIVTFDNGFMQACYDRHDCAFLPAVNCDVLEMSRDLVKKGETENYRLGTIANYYGVDRDLTFHNSMDDVIATMRLLKIFKGDYEDLLSREKELCEKVNPCEITSVRFWQGYRGFSRLYINADIGTFYYDIRSKVWGIKPDTPYSLEEVDMESLKTLAFQYANVSTEQEFARFRG